MCLFVVIDGFEECLRAKAIAPKGQKVTLTTTARLEATVTMMLLVSLRQQAVFLKLKKGTNNQYDFLSFIVEALISRALVVGDFLVLDNASIHGATDTIEIVAVVLAFFGVRIIRLPTYSPELNPCELVFNQIKSWLRKHRAHNIRFDLEILRATAFSTSLDMNRRFYRHCIDSGLRGLAPQRFR